MLHGADPAFLLRTAQTKRAEAFLQGLAPGPVVAIAPRRWFHYTGSLFPVKGRVQPAMRSELARRYREALVGAMNYVVEELGGTAVMVSMRPGGSDTPGQDDDIFAQELLTKVNHPDRVILMPTSFTPEEIKYCLKHVDLLIGVRMHATVLALGSHTPCINIYYNEKGFSLFKYLKLKEYSVSIESCSAGDLILLMRRIQQDRAILRSHIANQLEELQKTVQAPYEFLSQII